MRVVAPILLLAVACSDPSSDVVGPFTGPMRQFVVDRVDVPRDSTDAEAFAADLDGDGKPENKFGYATAVLASTNDLSLHASDMIASGALLAAVYIQADDMLDDDSVGVVYMPYTSDIGTAALVGGRFTDGMFVSNRTRDIDQPVDVFAPLPVFVNADPVGLQIDGLEIELAPDGADGYDATVRGGVALQRARDAARIGLVQMFETEPERHLVFQRGIDENRDDMISAEELEISVIGLLVDADIQLFSGDDYRPVPGSTMPDSVSIAVRLHLSPCDVLPCVTTQPVNTCRDRTRDAGETDIDCGGPCQKCAAGKACSGPADCQSNACDAGSCRAASCSDGVRDGYESDVDCGGACPACTIGKTCAADRDCASNNCNNGIASLGTCS